MAQINRKPNDEEKDVLLPPPEPPQAIATPDPGQAIPSPVLAPPDPVMTDGPGSAPGALGDGITAPPSEGPPLPPPAPANPLGGAIEDAALEGLGNPSRYDADFIQQMLGLIDSDIEEQFGEGEDRLAEHFASRGLIGSSLESEGMADFSTDLERERLRRMLDLEDRVAGTFASDRASAFQNALGARGQTQQEQQFFAQLSQQDRQFWGQMSQQDRVIDLQERGFEADDAYRYAALAEDADYRQAVLELQAQGLELDEAFRRAELEFRQSSTDEALDLDRLRTILDALLDTGGMSEKEVQKILDEYFAPEPPVGDPVPA